MNAAVQLSDIYKSTLGSIKRCYDIVYKVSATSVTINLEMSKLITWCSSTWLLEASRFEHVYPGEEPQTPYK